MPTSNQQLELVEASWPPTFASYTGKQRKELSTNCGRRIENAKAPDTYRKFMQHISQDLNERQSDKVAIQKLTDKANLYSSYVKTTEQTYNTLAEIHKEERRAPIKRKIKKMEMDHAARITELKNVVVHLKNTYVTTLEQTKEDFEKISNKQAQGRKNIEEKLISREFELGELRSKHRDTEAQLIKTREEFDVYKAENIQLRSLVVHLRNNSMIPHQQQHIQPQNHHYQ
ncbi:unnamed protein product [Mucor hiemalis]